MAKANRFSSGNDTVMVFEDFPVSRDEMDPEKLAASICVNSLFMGGDTKKLIDHMQHDHGFSFEQINIGITEIRKITGDCFDGWEKFFTK